MSGFNLADFNWVDYVFIAIFVVSILGGFVRGLLREVLGLVVLVAAFIVAMMFSNALAVYFTSTASVQQAVTTAGASADQPASYLAVGISFGVLFLGTVIVGAIINFFINLVMKATVLGIGNRLLGGLFGFFRAILINLVIVFVIQLTSMGDSDAWQQSQLVTLFQPTAAWLSNIVAPTYEDLKAKFSKTMVPKT